MSCNEGQVTSIKDIQIVWATDYSEDGLDFLLNKNTTYIYPDSSTVLKEDMFFCTLTDQDYSLAKDILKNYDETKPLNISFRIPDIRDIGDRDENGERIKIRMKNYTGVNANIDKTKK